MSEWIGMRTEIVCRGSRVAVGEQLIASVRCDERQRWQSREREWLVMQKPKPAQRRLEPAATWSTRAGDGRMMQFNSESRDVEPREAMKRRERWLAHVTLEWWNASAGKSSMQLWLYRHNAPVGPEG